MEEIQRVVAFGEVTEEGKTVVFNKDRFTKRIQEKFKGKKIKWICEEDNTVSQGQRGFYHAVMLPIIVKHLYEGGVTTDKDEIDLYLRMKFLYTEELVPSTGAFEKIPLSLSADSNQVSKPMMEEFRLNVNEWADDYLKLFIPEPDKNWKDKQNK